MGPKRPRAELLADYAATRQAEIELLEHMDWSRPVNTRSVTHPHGMDGELCHGAHRTPQPDDASQIVL
jgi:hypothetical protein